MAQRTYLAIDLKSYYASAECAARHLDPLTTNLVVADASRTEKTICLAVSPSLKSYGIPGRARLFEVVQRVKEVNNGRLRDAIRNKTAVYKDGVPSLSAASYDATTLAADPSLEVSYLVAPPRMAYYEKISRQIYGIYLKYIAPEDIVVYSIDEVFIDATAYLTHYKMSAHDLAMTMVREVLYTTGITATAGIGTNLYLAKLAMDITAKHAAPDKDGVRIAELDEESFRYLLWDHKPLTDFWQTGPGTVRRLEKHGIHTMGELARASIHFPEILYKEFGMESIIASFFGRIDFQQFLKSHKLVATLFEHLNYLLETPNHMTAANMCTKIPVETDTIHLRHRFRGQINRMDVHHIGLTRVQILLGHMLHKEPRQHPNIPAAKEHIHIANFLGADLKFSKAIVLVNARHSFLKALQIQHTVLSALLRFQFAGVVLKTTLSHNVEPFIVNAKARCTVTVDFVTEDTFYFLLCLQQLAAEFVRSHRYRAKMLAIVNCDIMAFFVHLTELICELIRNLTNNKERTVDIVLFHNIQCHIQTVQKRNRTIHICLREVCMVPVFYIHRDNCVFFHLINSSVTTTKTAQTQSQRV